MQNFHNHSIKTVPFLKIQVCSNLLKEYFLGGLSVICTSHPTYFCLKMRKPKVYTRSAFCFCFMNAQIIMQTCCFSIFLSVKWKKWETKIQIRHSSLQKQCPPFSPLMYWWDRSAHSGLSSGVPVPTSRRYTLMVGWDPFTNLFLLMGQLPFVSEIVLSIAVTAATCCHSLLFIVRPTAVILKHCLPISPTRTSIPLSLTAVQLVRGLIINIEHSSGVFHWPFMVKRWQSKSGIQGRSLCALL